MKNSNSFPQDHSGGTYLLLTLKEVKEMVDSTAGRRRPTPKYLREYGKLLVRKDLEDCCLEVYKSGFAIYQTAHHYTVLRMEETGEPGYSSVVDEKYRRINTENMDWSIGVMLCGEERTEAEFRDKASDRLISMTVATPNDHGGNTEWREMEFETDDYVDAEDILLETDVIEMLLSSLTERQKQVACMYYFQEMTQREIADALGIKQPIISKCLKAVVSKAKKIFL